MLLPGTRRQTPTQAVRTVAKQQETQAHSGKRGGGVELVEWKEGWGRGVRCLKNTLNFRLRCGMCGDQKSLFVSRSQAGYVLEVE